MRDEATPAAEACRFCGGPTRQRFRLQVLGRHDVGYLECATCASLQTETPWWLEEAYGAGSLASLDTGAAQRNLRNFAAVSLVLGAYGARNLIDVGGGDGLLCRMLRDHGFNAYVEDRYAVPLYAPAFTEPDFETPQALLAFEVLEHFAEPADELGALLSRGAELVMLTTGDYRGQGETWWYLAPEAGQHVFFWSRQALEMAAEKHGYRLDFLKEYAVFTTRDAPAIRRRLRLAFKGRVFRLLSAWLLSRPAPGAWRDHLAVRDRLRAEADGRPEP